MTDAHIGDYVRQAHIISEILKLRPVPRLILDAGSGTGAYGLRLAQVLKASSVACIEIDPASVQTASFEAQATNVRNVSFSVGDITRDLGTERFDLIYSVDVMEHIEDDTAVFGNFHDALKCGGVLILHVPKKKQKFFLSSLGLFKECQDDHVREGYEEDEVKQKLQAAGFAITTVRYTFSFCTSFLWEVMQIIIRLGTIGNTAWRFAFFLLKPIIDKEFKESHPEGNGLLIVARKGTEQ